MTSSILPVYARAPLTFESGEGAWMTAAGGRRYLDFGSGIAVNALGHAHPKLVAALTDQAGRIWHLSNLYQNPLGESLAKRLTDATFADVVFFTNSGAEALEASIKMARKHHAVNGRPERNRIVTFEGAFHGRTLATIAAGGQRKYMEGFGPDMPGFDQVPFGDEAALKAAIGPETAAILLEPVQGEGGIRPVPTERLRAIRALCDEHGILLILDEVQSGVGRTGRLFAHEKAGIAPDIMAIAKGIGGGFPLGACLATAEVAKGMVPGTHGSTFGGNPLAMAVGNAVLDVVLGDGFLARVEQVALLLKQRLAELADRHPAVIAEMRGEGLMIGLKLHTPNADFVRAAEEEGLLVIAAGDNVVRLLPPLVITDEDVGEAVARLDGACERVEAAMEREAKALRGAAA